MLEFKVRSSFKIKRLQLISMPFYAVSLTHTIYIAIQNSEKQHCFLILVMAEFSKHRILNTVLEELEKSVGTTKSLGIYCVKGG